MLPFDRWWHLANRGAGNESAPSPSLVRPAASLVFRQHAGRVYNLARRMLDNDADAEDVLQEVFLQVARKLDTFRGEAELTTWLHRITVNAVLLHRRTKRRRPECRPAGNVESLALGSGRLPADSPGMAPDRQAMCREARRLIEGAVGRLPAKYRDVFVLADFEHQNNAQICAALGLSLPAVKSRLHRARLLLRQLLGPRLAAPL